VDDTRRIECSHDLSRFRFVRANALQSRPMLYSVYHSAEGRLYINRQSRRLFCSSNMSCFCSKAVIALATVN